MATARVTKVPCTKCNKLKNTVKCPGCEKDFCWDDMNVHRQELSEQLGHTEDQFNQFTNEIGRENTDLRKHLLMQRVDRWEQQSIDKIRKMAEEVRHELLAKLTNSRSNLQLQLKQLTDRLIVCRKENDFLDTDIHFYNEELHRLKTMLNNSYNLHLQQTEVAVVTGIRLAADGEAASSLPVPLPRTALVKSDTKWLQAGVTVAGGNGGGNGMNQLKNPWRAVFDDDHTLFIADGWNHRIVAWGPNEKTGRLVAGGHGQGNRADQLNSPTDLIIDRKTDSLIISDYGNRRVIRWPRHNGTKGEVITPNVACYGLAMDDERSLYVALHDVAAVSRCRPAESESTVVAGGNGLGNRLNQLNAAKAVFVDRDLSVYVSDSGNARVIKWTKDAKEGIVVAGSRLTQLSSPNGIVVDESGSVYVVDTGNSRIMRWNKGATEGTVVVGGNGKGDRENQLSDPTGLSFDREGNLYVVDHGNSRVQRFGIHRS